MLSLESLFYAGFALGGLSLLVFILGVLGLLSVPFIAGALVLVLSLFVFSVYGFREKGSAAPLPFTGIEKILLLAIAGVVVLMLPLALTPPAVRDELIQHLALPKLYLSKGRIYDIPFMTFGYLPHNIDLLYLVPLAFGSDTAAKLLHLLLGLLTGILIYQYLLPTAGRKYALLGMLTFISAPLVFNLSRMAYADLGSAFFSTLSLVAALKWKDEGGRKWLVFSAVAMGFAISSKYNNLISFGLVGAFILFTGIKKKGFLKGAGSAFLYAVLVVAVLSPWFARNYALKGSPLYPIYERAVKSTVKGEGVHITGEMAPLLKRQLLYNEGPVELALLPLRIFTEGKDNSIEKFDGVMNPFFLIFLPIAFMGRRADRWPLALFIMFFFIMAASAVDLVTRYLLPAVPPLIILVTLGVKNAFEFGRLRWLAVTLVMALFTYNILYTRGLYEKYSPLKYLAGEGRGGYLSRILPDYDVIKFANENLPEKAKVLFIFTGDRGYYWDRDYVYYDRLGNTLKIFLKGSRNKAELFEKFRQTGSTHLFIRDALFERFLKDNLTEGELSVFMEFNSAHMRRLYGHNGYSLYELSQ